MYSQIPTTPFPPEAIFLNMCFNSESSEDRLRKQDFKIFFGKCFTKKNIFTFFFHNFEEKKKHKMYDFGIFLECYEK